MDDDIIDRERHMLETDDLEAAELTDK